MNAQNHIYDAGTRGIFETVAEVNRAQLMHVGVNCGEEDKRYLLLDVNGIKIALLAYMDSARQKMKRVNFSKRGLSQLFNYFDESQIEHDVSSAREDGAEFIIAYCH